MKDGKTQLCGGEKPKPRPNLKNKNFVKWTKAEPFKIEDNIISSEWHERLQKIAPFTPVYDNAPTNMVYLMSGEYGRMWQKERDEWFSTVFVLNKKENDMESRKRKIRKQAKEAKKAAEKNIQARKERKTQEAEIKAKVLKSEKLKKEKEKEEKLRKEKEEKEAMARRKSSKRKSTKTETVQPSGPEKIEPTTPKGWRQVELTVQCECSSHSKEESVKPQKVEEPEIKQNLSIQQQEQKPSEKQNEPHMCEDYIKQLKEIHEKKEKESMAPKAQDT